MFVEIMKILKAKKKLIIFISIILLFVKGCYEFLHIDYLVVDYVNACPTVFQKDDFYIKVKYLGTHPNISNYWIKEILNPNIISYIEFNNSKSSNIKSTNIKILDCQLSIFSENGLIPYKTIKTDTYPSVKDDKQNLTETALSPIANVDISGKEHYIIQYFYQGDFKDIQEVYVKLKIIISIDDVTYTIEKAEKIDRKEKKEVSWGPFV